MENNYWSFVFNTFLPCLFLLFNLGTTVYIMGEYKENYLNIPKILKYILIKLITISILQVLILHCIFENKYSNNFTAISILIGIFVIIETYFTQKLLINMYRYLNKLMHSGNYIFRCNSLQIYLRERTLSLLRKNHILISVIVALIGLLIGSLTINIFRHFSIFNLLLLISLLFIIIAKISLHKTIKEI